MALRAWSLAAALAVCALICALPARALGSATEESMLMDDQQLIYSSPSTVAWTLQQARDLGIDRVKVSVVWLLLAPHPSSATRPDFDAADPAAYPDGVWDRYDRIVTLARQLGLQVYFEVVPPAPAWAVATSKPTQGYAWSQKPSASAFGQFVQAVATRYSGHYVPEGADQPLPRVSYWGLWNEPNEGAWLNPQWRLAGPGRRKHLFYVAPAMYRALANAGYQGLQAAGHAADTILIGETAARGWIHPMPFLRALYCVGPRNRPLKGVRARQLECPPSGNPVRFVADNPGLFRITGYAHHPYSFDVSPSTHIPDWITLQNLSTLERGLNGILGGFGQHRPGGMSLYLTEWGYKTNPPNPFVRTSLSQQADWINEGEYMSWRYPYVRGLAQFLLVDDKPAAGVRRGSRAYWGTFQTGLLYADDRPKPSYDAFRLPIWLPDARHGAHVPVWVQLRPADVSGNDQATLEFQRRGSRTWSDLAAVTSTNPRGFLFARVRVPAAGYVRLAWRDPENGTVYHSRSARVR